MCLTHLSGEGDCVDLSRDGDFCDDRDEMKVIVSEVVREGGKMECSMVSEDEDKEKVADFYCLCLRLPL